MNMANFYASLLKQCASSKSVTQTRIAHLQLTKSGFPYLHTLGNSLIDAYVKCGCSDDARKMFDLMPDSPHIVSWNNIMSSYIRRNRSEDAVRLFRIMVLSHKGVTPDEFTFSAIFRAFSKLGCCFLNEARKAHGRMVVSGVVDYTDAIVGSALVDMYAKFGRLGDAWMVFDGIVDKDVVLFTAMIVGYTQNREDSKALRVYGDMIAHGDSGVKGNEFTFASVLIACGNSGNMKTGFQIHSVIIKSGLESRNPSQTSLMTMYSKFSLVEESLKIFDQIKKPNAITYTAIISALVSDHREEKAMSMFRDMIRVPTKPNEYTLSTTMRACSGLALILTGKQIHALTVKIGLESDSFVGASLVDMYGKCGNLKMARLVLNGLPKFGLVPLNSMIYGYAQNGFGCKALKLFDRIQTEFGLEPNEATFTSVLSACSSSGLLEDGRRIFTSISTPSIDHYACLVDLFCRAGELDEAELIITTQIKNPDGIVWRSLLSGCKIHGNVEMAERAAMRLLEIDPGDHATHILLSNIYASKGMWNEVIRIKRLMRDMKVKKEPAMSWVEINREVYTFMAGKDNKNTTATIYEKLDVLIKKTKEMGYMPDTKFVLQEMSEVEKERSLYNHSEKLAIAFAVFCSTDTDDGMKNKKKPIMIFKNLRVCGDCHTWMKFVTKVISREISARDAKRFHHFKDGLCSCGDYW
ncbi:Pentatricopeptide repeat protein [Zostera marina]|uniref:Pentatricopeptide repeat protein n=1 Tax=Zostera marina TaxID=29655 RepID=A0A0K9PQ61_ZOSMR|nr:Pentatricopeptide repeat protein [Zostera marina]